MCNDDALRDNFKPKLKLIETIKEITNSLDLVDLWRVRNLKIKKYTWRSSNLSVQTRLDYFFVTSPLQSDICYCEIIPSVFSDRSAITLQVEPLEYGRSGSAFWKLNTTLLNDKYHVKKM